MGISAASSCVSLFFALSLRPYGARMRIHTRQLQGVWSLVAQSLSGRLLLLTVLYTLASGALIFLPAMGIKERELLDEHILSAELTILPFTTPGQDWPDELRQNLLRHANADEVLLRRPYQRDFFQIGMLHSRIDRTIDLTHDWLWNDIANAMECLFRGGARTLHVMAPTRIRDAQSISIILSEAPIRTQLLTYARRVVGASAFISGFTGALVFISLYYFVVRPMRRITRAMGEFHENPEDARRIMVASSRADEIGVAERELAAMQRDLYGFLRQKERLAGVGAAVSRIQHDLRNILSNAQLASDRLAASDNPEVKRLAPRLMAALDRAIALATTTLKYGRAEERPPVREDVALRDLVDEAAGSLSECHGETSVCFENAIDESFTVHADREQLFRIVLNLLRNACEALDGKGSVRVCAARGGGVVTLEIADSGPGIAEQVRAKLFQPFVSAARPGGSGLGLAIARDLARGHGGDLTLVSTGPDGTVFRLTLPE
jgi:signal transduction histidine kinase